MMTTIYRTLLIFALLAPQTACSKPPPDASKPSRSTDLLQWHLPKALREVSGLAMLDEDSLLAIQDERAEVFQLNVKSGEVVRRFTLGKPTAKGDFEGVAVYKKRLYLLTSEGVIYEAALSPDADWLPYVTYDSGLSKTCELEGLAHQPNTALLWLACKNVFAETDAPSIHLHAWSTQSHSLVPTLAKILPTTLDSESTKFNPSGLAFTPDGRKLLLVAARQASYAWLSFNDNNVQLLGRAKLPSIGKHRQTEGVSITGQGWLLLADEGKKKRGRLSRYSEPFPE